MTLLLRLVVVDQVASAAHGSAAGRVDHLVGVCDPPRVTWLGRLARTAWWAGAFISWEHHTEIDWLLTSQRFVGRTPARDPSGLGLVGGAGRPGHRPEPRRDHDADSGRERVARAVQRAGGCPCPCHGRTTAPADLLPLQGRRAAEPQALRPRELGPWPSTRRTEHWRDSVRV